MGAVGNNAHLSPIPENFSGLAIYTDSGKCAVRIDGGMFAKRRGISVKTTERLVDQWVRAVLSHTFNCSVRYYANGTVVPFESGIALLWNNGTIEIANNPVWDLSARDKACVDTFRNDVRSMKRFRVFLVWSFQQWGLPKDLSRWIVQTHFQDPIENVHMYV